MLTEMYYFVFYDNIPPKEAIKSPLYYVTDLQLWGEH